MDEQKIVIYKNENNEIELRADIEEQTLWLDQKAIAKLFGVNVPAISKHIRNIYNEQELQEDRTVSKMEIVQKEGSRKVERLVDFYNLDMIIAVGYRVNSGEATQFRIWATSILREYVVSGYVVNSKKLREDSEKLRKLQSHLKTLQRVNQFEEFGKDEANELIKIITDYAGGLELMDKYDHDDIDPNPSKGKTVRPIKYVNAKSEINVLREIECK